MSIKVKSLEADSQPNGITQGDSNQTLPTKPKRKQPPYTYVMPNRARWAMEDSVKDLKGSQGTMDEMLESDQRQKQGFDQLEGLLSQMSNADRRMPDAIKLVRELRLNQADFGSLIARMALANTNAESTLTQEMARGRHELAASPAPEGFPPTGGNGTQGVPDGQQQPPEWGHP